MLHLSWKTTYICTWKTIDNKGLDYSIKFDIIGIWIKILTADKCKWGYK